MDQEPPDYMNELSQKKDDILKEEEHRADEASALLLKLQDRLESVHPQDVDMYLEQIEYQMSTISELSERKKLIMEQLAMTRDATKPQEVKIKDSNEPKDPYKGDDFLVWEPFTKYEKIECITKNLFEVNYLVFAGILSMVYQCLYSGILFVLSYIFLSVTANELRQRCAKGIKFMIVRSVLFSIIFIVKLTQLSSIYSFKTDDKTIYTNNLNYYMFLGFYFIQSEDDQPNAEGNYTLDVNLRTSFTFDAIVAISTASCIFLLEQQRRTLKELSDPSNKEGIIEMIDLMVPQDQKKKSVQAFQSSRNRKIEKQQLEFEQNRKQERLKEIRSQFKKNFVESNYFLRFKTIFYSLFFIFQMFEALAYNSCIAIPSLFMLLALTAFHKLDTHNTENYNTGKKWFVYFIQFLMAIKILDYNTINQPFVSDWINDNRENTFVRVHEVIFGGYNSNENKCLIFFYQVSLYGCIVFGEAWNITKKIDVRRNQQKIEMAQILDLDRDLCKIDPIFRFSQANVARSAINVLSFTKLITKNAKELEDKKDSKDNIKFMTRRPEFAQNYPSFILWSTRLNIFIQSYLYPSNFRFMTIAWIITTFLMTPENTFWFGYWGMLPMLSFQFVFMYGAQIPVLNTFGVFKFAGGHFQEVKMSFPMVEQAYIFITLILFYQYLNAYRLVRKDRFNGENKLIEFFKRRINDPKYPEIWKFIFFSCRYLQTVVLLVLFAQCMTNLKSLRNLGYMVFFVVYTAYENIYRKTSKLLILFMSFFIMVRYYTSLHSKFFITLYNDEMYQEVMKFFNLDHIGNEIVPQMSQTWRMWVLLVLMGQLDDINQMYNNKKAIENLEENASNLIRDKHTRSYDYAMRIKIVVKSVMIYIINVIIVTVSFKLDINLINWVFFSLNSVSFAMFIRSTNSYKNLRNQLKLIRFVKFYSLVILMINMMFVVFIGENESKDPDSLDQKFKGEMPRFYQYLDVIGLRTNQNFLVQSAEQSFQHKVKYSIYVLYFLLSIVLEDYYEDRINFNKDDDQFTDKDYKKLFEYETHSDIAQFRRNFASLLSQSLSQKHEHESLSRASIKKKAAYHFQDLIDKHEHIRFTKPFLVYKCMNWWPVFDFIADNSHLCHYMLIVIIAIYVNLCLFMCVNMLCLCSFYLLTTITVYNQSRRNHDMSGLQSQCDVKMAQLITKRHKIESRGAHLIIRQKMWYFQWVTLMVFIIAAFPTQIIPQIRSKLDEDDSYRQTIDWLSFWTFCFGIYRDQRPGNEMYFYATYASLFVSLIIERQSINWLVNRFGCTYYRLQKFVELDTRRQAIKKHWEVCPVPYEPEKYEEHYFLNDFDQIKKKFSVKTMQDQPDQDEYGNDTIQDFIPFRQARRLRDTIVFKLKLDSGAPEIYQDDQTKELLKGDYDYETIPVLNRYKIEFFQKVIQENVDRKYRISLAKGFNLVAQNMIWFALMLTIIIKANISSLIYLIFLILFAYFKNKAELMVKFQKYLAVNFMIQYLLYFLNLNSRISPAPLPPGYESYPKSQEEQAHVIPVFFVFKIFRSIEIDDLIGIGLFKEQLHYLILDFFVLVMISTYTMYQSNPVLQDSMKKVFWCFPSKEDSEKWQRLDQNVQKQVIQLYKPSEQLLKEFDNWQVKQVKLTQEQINIKRGQCEFAEEYQNNSKKCLNYILTNYVDLKYDKIWSEDFIKQKKGEFKNNSNYYRIVKQGSILVYLTFHIFTIFTILFMAIMRQTVISLGYLFCLMLRLKDADKVLDQRQVQIEKYRHDLQKDIKKIHFEITELSAEDDTNKIRDLEAIIEEKEEELKQIQKKIKKAGSQNQQQQEQFQELKKWEMITLVQGFLLVYGLVDFSLQIVAQMPIFEDGNVLSFLGIKKVWQSDYYHENAFRQYLENKQGDFSMNYFNLGMKVMNCIIISSIILQNDIFKSTGYIKFVSQINGSMDLLLELSHLKQMSTAYIFNNKKIDKIVSIQQKREEIFQTVDQIRSKLIAWRMNQQQIFDSQQQQQSESESDDDVQLLKKNDLIPSVIGNQDPVNTPRNRIHDVKNRAESNFNIVSSNNRVKENSRGAMLNRKATLKRKGTIIKEQEIEIDYFEQYMNRQIDELQRKNKIIQTEGGKALIKKMASKFVSVKIGQMKWYVRLYNFLNKNFTEGILFKNQKSELVLLNDNHCKGSTTVPTELEKIMSIEAEELIRQNYDDTTGNQELRLLVEKAKANPEFDLLKYCGFVFNIKLRQMEVTYQFTRPFSMLMRLVETLFYITISQTENLIYASMIFSMYTNAGLISIFYPIAVFGHALLEEGRPNSNYWSIILNYSSVVVVIKFMINLFVFDRLLSFQTFEDYTAYVKTGLYESNSIIRLVQYMIPEILVISFIMLNEIKLKLLGMNHQNEIETESVKQAIRRSINKGDKEKMDKELAADDVNIKKYFIPLDEQIEKNFEDQGEVKRSVEFSPADLYDAEDLNDQMHDEQAKILEDISKHVASSYRVYDQKHTGHDHHESFREQLICDNMIKRTLVSDELLFIEGKINQQSEIYLAIKNSDLKKTQSIEAVDYEDDYEKFNNLDQKDEHTHMGIFEKYHYFDGLFPSMGIQKPGYDLYGSTTLVLVIILIFIMNFFEDYNVDPEQFKFFRGKSSLFKTQMAITLVLVITIIIIERYASRSDSKAPIKKKIGKQTQNNTKDEQKEHEDKTQPKKSADRQETTRNYLLQMFGGSKDGDYDFVEDTIKITAQQKTKYILHWFVLIVGHLYVFWMVPIFGNLQLYGQADCNYEQKEFYGCKNFHLNPTLRVLYVLILLYLILSSLQLRYGFPLHKKPSSLLKYNNSLGKLGADIFYAAPFAIEIRCLADFAFTKSSLDVFQFVQLWLYHYHAYGANQSNRYYDQRKLGSPNEKSDKIIFGGIVGSVFIVMFVGPFLMFSDFGGLVTQNPVLSGDVAASFVFQTYPNFTQDQFDDNDQPILKEIPIFHNANPFFRNFDKDYFEQSEFHNWTETSFFEPNQIQECFANEYSDNKWKLSQENEDELRENIFNLANKDKGGKLGLKLKFDLSRKASKAREVTYEVERYLDFTEYDDCQTGKQIQVFAQEKCESQDQIIEFKSVYVPYLVLGQGEEVSPIERGNTDKDQQKQDVILRLDCKTKTWFAHQSMVPTKRRSEKVDPETCEPLKKNLAQMMADKVEEDKKDWEEEKFSRLRIVIFSMLVSSSFLAGSSPGAFYSGILLGLATLVRPIFMHLTFAGWVYEATQTEDVIRLIEAVVLYQHEEDLYGEEECYRMLQEIMRQPEFYKSLCGSSLKGKGDPKLDKLSDEKKNKFMHLDKLEQKGFDVDKLKQRLLHKKSPEYAAQ